MHCTLDVKIDISKFSFGMIDQITGGMRPSMLSLVIFFLIGGILLWTMKEKVKNIAPPYKSVPKFEIQNLSCIAVNPIQNSDLVH
ncbi:MAG: hypothetical protein AB8F78_18845 [Saprospiraceae bacterium]